MVILCSHLLLRMPPKLPHSILTMLFLFLYVTARYLIIGATLALPPLTTTLIFQHSCKSALKERKAKRQILELCLMNFPRDEIVGTPNNIKISNNNELKIVNPIRWQSVYHLVIYHCL